MTPAPDPVPLKVSVAGFQTISKSVPPMVPEQVFTLNLLKYPVQVASTVFPNRVPLMVVPLCVIVSLGVNPVLQPHCPVFIHSTAAFLMFFLPSNRLI